MRFPLVLLNDNDLEQLPYNEACQCRGHVQNNASHALVVSSWIQEDSSTLKSRVGDHSILLCSMWYQGQCSASQRRSFCSCFHRLHLCRIQWHVWVQCLIIHFKLNAYSILYQFFKMPDFLLLFWQVAHMPHPKLRSLYPTERGIQLWLSTHIAPHLVSLILPPHTITFSVLDCNHHPLALQQHWMQALEGILCLLCFVSSIPFLLGCVVYWS
jgi:hypothetical protein